MSLKNNTAQKTGAAEAAAAIGGGDSAALNQSSPPASNTGGTVSEAYSHLVMVGGKLKEVPLKRGSSSVSFIDTLTVVFKEDVFIRPDQLGTEEEVICNASAFAEEIFGYGLTAEKNGRNGYKRSFLMGTDEHKYGFFMIGGMKQHDTVCFNLTGTGLIAAFNGWEHRLYSFMLQNPEMCKITRCDLAHDFLDGEYTPEIALSEWEKGLFTTHVRKPVAECVGSDWLDDRGKGKTLYVGSRKNASRFVRIYEKGKQLGDEESPWVRVEVEFHNRDIVIPLDVLVEPGRYLVGAYPAFQILFADRNETPAKAEVKKKISDISIPHVLKYASMQCSPSIAMMKEMGMDNDEIVSALENGNHKLPKRLAKEAFDCSHLVVEFIHKVGRIPRTVEDILLEGSYGLDRRNVKFKRFKHRTMQEFLDQQERHYLNQEFRTDGGKPKSYEEYMWRRHITPSFLLNRKANHYVDDIEKSILE